MKVVETRAELTLRGVLLGGPVVPEWFKRRSDGCSVPGRLTRRLLRADRARPVCYIHDYEYFEAALKFEPGTAGFVAGVRGRISRCVLIGRM